MPDAHSHEPGTRENPIQAAGAICWRRASDDGGRLEFLLVRSVRWDEWSWPKGKLDPHESFPEAAVREVLEETGARVTLGVPLPSLRYEMPDGRHKRVDLWTARITEQGRPTAADDEIAEVAWFSAAEARARLSRGNGNAPLDRMLELDQQGLLDGGQLIVIRHAKAVGRVHWDGDDAQRPLAEVGLRQSARLARMLDCWRPDRLLSSPWSRCLATLQPYEEVSGLTIEAAPEFTERAYEKHPRRTTRATLALLGEPGRIALCTHRPVLAAVAGTLAGTATDAAVRQLPDHDPWLAPGQLLIGHHHGGRVFWVEIH